MGVFEADSFLESSLHFEYPEIDVDELLNRIQTRYADYREHSYASHPLCVVSIEEYRALTYGFQNWTNIHKIRCQSFENLIKKYQARVDGVIDSETLKSAVFAEAGRIDAFYSAPPSGATERAVNPNDPVTQPLSYQVWREGADAQAKLDAGLLAEQGKKIRELEGQVNTLKDERKEALRTYQLALKVTVEQAKTELQADHQQELRKLMQEIESHHLTESFTSSDHTWIRHDSIDELDWWQSLKSRYRVTE